MLDNKYIGIVKAIICIIICIIILNLILAYLNNKVYTKEAGNTEEVVVENESLFTLEKGSYTDYKAPMVSYNSNIFTLRKVNGTTGLARYRIVLKTNHDTYKIYTVSESLVHLNILNSSEISDAYAIANFSGSKFDDISSIELYLPSTYKIENVSDTDNIYESYGDK